MDFFFVILPVSYLVFGLGLKKYWNKISFFSANTSLQPKTFLSIIIPVRNEGENIGALLQDLEAQNYPKHLYEVLVMDDNSTDGGGDIIRNFAASFALKVIRLKEEPGRSHKKSAIRQGIENSAGTLIVTTDGDCRAGNLWLRSLENFYQCRGSKFIFGGVTFHKEFSIFEKIQTVEFASLTGSGAACLTAGYPNMCNGANLAFEKGVFDEVGGYSGFDQIPSGDDEFLMHKVYLLYPDKVHFIKSREAIVYTAAKKTLGGFFNQRKRWAGKWKYYLIKNIRVLACYIFVCNLALVIATAAVVAGQLSFGIFFFAWMGKLLPDYLFINDVLQFYGKKNKPLIFIITAVFYPFYVSFFGISSNIGKYRWKGRNF